MLRKKWQCKLCGRWHPATHKQCYWCFPTWKTKTKEVDMIDEKKESPAARTLRELYEKNPKMIECKSALGFWGNPSCGTPDFDDPTCEFRVVVDEVEIPGVKFAKEIEAFKNGLTIQFRDSKNGETEWEDCPAPIWSVELEYRIKPRTFRIPVEKITSFFCTTTIGGGCELRHGLNNITSGMTNVKELHIELKDGEVLEEAKFDED